MRTIEEVVEEIKAINLHAQALVVVVPVKMTDDVDKLRALIHDRVDHALTLHIEEIRQERKEAA